MTAAAISVGRLAGPSLTALGVILLAALFAVLNVLPELRNDALQAAAYDVQRMTLLYATLPRMATALLAGAALGLSGALFQQVLRNPLASPTTLGVSGRGQSGTCADGALRAGPSGNRPRSRCVRRQCDSRGACIPPRRTARLLTLFACAFRPDRKPVVRCVLCCSRHAERPVAGEPLHLGRGILVPPELGHTAFASAQGRDRRPSCLADRPSAGLGRSRRCGGKCAGRRYGEASASCRHRRGSARRLRDERRRRDRLHRAGRADHRAAFRGTPGGCLTPLGSPDRGGAAMARRRRCPIPGRRAVGLPADRGCNGCFRLSLAPPAAEPA